MEALGDFNMAIKVAPENADLYNGRGFAWYLLNEPVEALQDFDRAIKLDPTFKTAYTNRGLAKEKLREQQQAAQNVAAASPGGK